MAKVLTYKPVENKVAMLEYTERTVHTEHGKMYNIVTSTGHEIKVTDDHSLTTDGTDNFFAPVPPQDSLGRFVPIPFRLDIFESSEDFEAINYDENNKLTWSSLDILAELGGVTEYAPKDDKDKALFQYMLFKAGLYYEFHDGKFTIDSECFGFVPEDGKLIPREEADILNQYRLLPFTWTKVLSNDEVEREEITYDFTVPEFPLFIGNFILVYDTMQVHVPVTEEARMEALDKMLPSKNLFSSRTLDPMMLPQQEHTFGAFLASQPSKEPLLKTNSLHEIQTKIDSGEIRPDHPVLYEGHTTTAGLVLINEVLPPEYRNYKDVWNKGIISKTMSRIGKEKPDLYTKAADGIKELGAHFAYLLGASFKAKDFDLHDLKKKRDIEFNKIDAHMTRIDKSSLSKSQKYDKKVELLRGAQDFSQKLTSDAKDNHFQQWAYSGSRGSKSQVMQIISSPVVVADPRDRVIPMLIRTSFNEGLSSADYWTSSYGTRKGTVSAKLSVQPGGMMAKELIGNVLDIVITENNCGTKEGITLPLADKKDVLERYEAVSNKLIDSRYYEVLHTRGESHVTVRSPIKCKAKHGVCQLCYGHDEKGHLPEIGNNVGVQAAQAITEPLTQMGLSSKHTAGTAAEEKVGLNTIQKFFQMPTQYSGAALIAGNSGKVMRIEAAPAGGTNIWIGTKRYHAVPGRKIYIKLGDEVKSGDILTSGIPNLSKIVPHKGIDFSRELFVNHAHDLYSKADAPSVRKNFETVARGLVNYVEIEDPGDFHFIHGDIANYNELMADIKAHPTEKPPTFKPIQKGTTWAPQDNPDWLANFGFKYLKKNLIENAAMGNKSNVHGYHPIAGYATATEFGEGEHGKY